MRNLLILVCALFIAPLFAEETKNWAQWRGPSGQGHVNDPRVPLEWSESKNLLWKVKLPGVGHSTPVVWGNKLFLTCATTDGAERWVVCVDIDAGKIAWQKPVAGGQYVKIHETNTFASPSCATDGKYVFA